jgi:hypothetical protein
MILMSILSNQGYEGVKWMPLVQDTDWLDVSSDTEIKRLIP